MPVEKSAGAVIFQNQKGIIKYLLLNYPSTTRGAKRPRSRVNTLRGRDYWDLPKGHIEKGEKELDTVKREVEEETGLKDIKIVEGFKEWIKYFFRHKEKTIFKIVIFYLAEAKSGKVKISEEHIGYKWLPFEKAIKQLTFKNARDILRKANNFLQNHAKI